MAVATCAVALLALTGCAASGSGSGADAGSTDAGDAGTSSQASSGDLPQIRIGTDDLYPFTYVDRDGERAGIDAEIAAEACRRAGLEPVYVAIPWSEHDAYLERGDIDCVWCGFAREGLEEDYLWTDPYLASSMGCAAKGSSGAASIADLPAGSTIAVRAGSISERLLLDGDIPSGGARVLSLGTTDMAKATFVKGYADALLTHEIVIEQLMADFPGQYRYIETDVATAHLAVAFKKGYSGPYYRAINDALASMKSDGTISEIAARYTQSVHGIEEGGSDAQ